MIVTESRRARHLVVQLQSDEELPAALTLALESADATSGWIAGLGELEAAEITVVDPLGNAPHVRRIDGRCNLVTLSGSITPSAGAAALRLSVTLARETDLGNEVCAGELVWARVHALELCVTLFDNPVSPHGEEPRAGMTALAPTTSSALDAQRAVPVASPIAPRAEAEPTPQRAPSKAQTPAQAATVEMLTPPAPLRRREPEDTNELYPEVGDRATHFHFGECTIISSDGERIRLRQERDGRIREVSLDMLRIEPPTTDGGTGQRTFLLSRKH